MKLCFVKVCPRPSCRREPNLSTEKGHPKLLKVFSPKHKMVKQTEEARYPRPISLSHAKTKGAGECIREACWRAPGPNPRCRSCLSHLLLTTTQHSPLLTPSSRFQPRLLSLHKGGATSQH